MEIGKKLTILVYCLCLILFLNCCNSNSTPIERNDIYAKCKKGDTISFELFKKAQRIIKTDKWYLIWLDLYKDGDDQYALHLLICDHNLVLKGATGTCPHITEANVDTLICIKSDEYEADKNLSLKLYRDDLPNEIILNFKKN